MNTNQKKLASLSLFSLTLFLGLIFSSLVHAAAAAMSATSCTPPTAYSTALAADSCSSGGGGSGGGSGGGGSGTPTPTPVPVTCSFLNSLYLDTSQTYFQTRAYAPYALDIQYAMDLWKNVLNCPASVLSQLTAAPGPAPVGKSYIQLVPESQFSSACPAWANETDADVNLVARVCFLANYGGNQNNPILAYNTQFKIVLNSNKAFAASNQFCFAGTCYPSMVSTMWIFESVMSHELGHAMGLDDVVISNTGSPDYNSIMNTYRIGWTGRWAAGWGLPSAFDGQIGHTAIGCN